MDHIQFSWLKLGQLRIKPKSSLCKQRRVFCYTSVSKSVLLTLELDTTSSSSFCTSSAVKVSQYVSLQTQTRPSVNWRRAHGFAAIKQYYFRSNVTNYKPYLEYYSPKTNTLELFQQVWIITCVSFHCIFFTQTIQNK